MHLTGWRRLGLRRKVAKAGHHENGRQNKCATAQEDLCELRMWITATAEEMLVQCRERGRLAPGQDQSWCSPLCHRPLCCCVARHLRSSLQGLRRLARHPGHSASAALLSTCPAGAPSISMHRLIWMLQHASRWSWFRSSLTADAARLLSASRRFSNASSGASCPLALASAFSM